MINPRRCEVPNHFNVVNIPDLSALRKPRIPEFFTFKSTEKPCGMSPAYYIAHRR